MLPGKKNWYKIPKLREYIPQDFPGLTPWKFCCTVEVYGRLIDEVKFYRWLRGDTQVPLWFAVWYCNTTGRTLDEFYRR